MKKLTLFIIASILLTGCQYLPVQVPNVVKSEQNYQKELNQIPSDEKDMLNKPIHIEWPSFNENGQEIKLEAEITILDTKIYKNIKEANYEEDRMDLEEINSVSYFLDVESDEIVDNPDIDELDRYILLDKETYPILEARLRIKNISFIHDFHVNDFHLKYRDKEKNLPYAIYAIYYDHLVKETKEAFHVPVGIGEEKEITIAWILADQDFDLKDYQLKVFGFDRVPLDSLVKQE